ncbi:uncharacterized protein LOC131658902 [Vicia villosa]|uniref:uncharacterized protein LOC131658902 n=1 Tax=Vicia villosa TaxID=3911 RepID=UPI00273A9777|nr:uncharacterized protein LOC131658902 [Vicia villosa]
MATPSFVSRPSKSQFMRLRIHHWGRFVDNPVKLYVGELITEMDWDWDVEYLSYMQIEELINAHGYFNIKCLWYWNPNFSFSHGLRPLNNDSDVLRFMEDVRGFKVVDIYVEHKVEEVSIDDVIFEEEVTVEVEVNNEEEVNVEENVEVEVDNKEEENVEVEVDNKKEVNAEENVEVEVDNEKEVNVEENVEVEVDNEEEVNDEENVEVEVDNREEVNVKENVEVEVDNEEGANVGENMEVEVDSDSESDPDYKMSSEEDEEDDEAIFDELDLGTDTVIDWTTILPTVPTQNPSTMDVISDNDSCDSDVLRTPPDRDAEDVIKEYPTFKKSTKLELGMMFKDKVQIKDAIREFALEKNKSLVIKKNDKRRVVIKCIEGCPFHIRFSMRSTNKFWKVVSFIDQHNCHRTAKNRQATTQWLARKFVDTLRHTPEMKSKELVAECLQIWGVKLSSHQAYRAKRKIIELIQGAGREQFNHLRSYAEELLKSNPNSPVIIKCVDSDAGPVFERIYVCLEACKAAFATTCRPLIGLDACFLKGDYGGQLIGAIGKDGNNKIYPIAYVVVEAETKDSWMWFLNLLLDDLNSVQQMDYGFIFDQQKGLVPAILETSQHVEHRLCVKHLYGNWRKKYPGIIMKEALWREARATKISGWQRSMNHMKELNPNAWKDMMDVPAASWSRSHFKTNTQCDLQVNNMCEAFNRAILEYRDKSIISLLEGIKYYITVRISTQKEKLGRYKGVISPNIKKVLERTKREAEGWIATWHADDDFSIFGVSNGVETYPLNLLQKKCGCRRWDLTGIPCCHAISCIWFAKKEPEEFVSSFYRKSIVFATYSHIVMPTNGFQLWPVNVSHPINPPFMRRFIGRPKKNRNKENDEPRARNTLPRSLQTVKCKKCGSFGHNKRTCKGKRAAERAIPKGGNKKAKKRLTKWLDKRSLKEDPKHRHQPKNSYFVRLLYVIFCLLAIL